MSHPENVEGLAEAIDSVVKAIRRGPKNMGSLALPSPEAILAAASNLLLCNAIDDAAYDISTEIRRARE